MMYRQKTMVCEDDSCMKKIFAMNLPADKETVVKEICGVLGAVYETIDSGCGMVKVSDILDGVDYTGATGLKESDSRKLNMEMVVFAGISSRELDIFLDRYRKSGVAPIALKSVATDTNRTWTVEKLYSELAKEYLFYKMHGRK